MISIIRRHRWQRLCVTVPSVVSVCHVHALCPNGRRYRHDFFCVRQHHVSARWRYNLAYIGQLFPPQILTQSDPPPVDLTVGDIRSQIAAEWSGIAQRSQWRAYRKPPSLFRMVPSLISYDFSSPKLGVPKAPHTRKFATSASTWRIRLKSDVASCQITSNFV